MCKSGFYTDGCISPTPTGGDLNTSSLHNASSTSIQTGGGGGGAGVGTAVEGGALSSATSSLISSVTSGQMPDSLKGGECYLSLFSLRISLVKRLQTSKTALLETWQDDSTLEFRFVVWAPMLYSFVVDKNMA